MRTNNLISNIMGSGESKVPVPGDGATILMYTDRRVGTVIWVSDDGKTVKVQEDVVKHDPTKEGGMGHQNWIFIQNIGGSIMTFTRRKNGKYIEQGDKHKNGTQCVFGYRDYYYDWSF